MQKISAILFGRFHPDNLHYEDAMRKVSEIARASQVEFRACLTLEVLLRALREFGAVRRCGIVFPMEVEPRIIRAVRTQVVGVKIVILADSADLSDSQYAEQTRKGIWRFPRRSVNDADVLPLLRAALRIPTPRSITQGLPSG